MKPLLISMKNKMFNSKDNAAVAKNIIGSFAVKGGALVLSLFTMPAYIRYFDNQYVLGLWFTIISVLSWVLTFDLGIGNGLRNHLVPALVERDDLRIKRLISSAYVSLGSVVFLTVILFSLTFERLDWNGIFNIKSGLVPEHALDQAVLIVFVGILLQFFLRLISSVLYAMQKSALINLMSLFSTIMILCYVLIAKTGSVSVNLIHLAYVHVVAINLPLLITTIVIFATTLKRAKPDLRFFSISDAKKVMKLGGIFFWVQIMYMILTATNEFLITWLSSSEKVVEYQIYNKLFLLAGTVFTLALTPIWSAVTKALIEKKYTWIKSLYKLLKKLALVAVLFEFGLIVILQSVINLWLGENAIEVNYLYAFIFAATGSIFIWNGVLSSIINGFGALKVQVAVFTFGALIKIPLSWVLVMALDSWIGVVLANAICMGLYSLIQPYDLTRIINKKIEGETEYV